MSHYVVFELRRLSRDPKFVVLTVLVPAMLYLMIAALGVSAMPGMDAGRASSMIGMACYAVLMVTVTNGVNVSLDRNIGWVAQLRATPLRAAQMAIGKMISGLLLSLFAVIVIFLIGGVLQDIQLSPVRWVAIGAIIWLGSVPFALLGLGLGCLTSQTTAGPTVMAVVVGMSAIGGLWVPVQLFPGTLQHISSALPTTRWAHLGQGIVLGNGAPVTDLAVLLAWAVGFGLLAALGFRRGALR